MRKLWIGGTRSVEQGIDWLIRTGPIKVGLVAMALGSLFLILSHAIGINFVTYEGREVGYAAAPNRSLNYVVLLPLIIFLAISTMGSARWALIKAGGREFEFLLPDQLFNPRIFEHLKRL